jgi:hypothetical protein
MAERDTLQQSMVQDFKKILATSSPLFNAYMDLPDDQKKKVEDHYLEWAWQCVLGAATALGDGVSEQDVPEFIKAFGGFVLSAQQGRHVSFKTSDWVAIDRPSYDDAVELAKQVRDGIAQIGGNHQ